MPESLWNTVPSQTQAAILTVIVTSEKRIAALEARLNQITTPRSRHRPGRPP